MSYDSEKVKMGRELAIIVELYLDCCSLTFGSSPCTASATDPRNKCYNTFPTCHDRPNFARSSKVYRFSNKRIDRIQTAGDAPTFPTLKSIDMAPTILTPGQGLGVRSNVSVSIQDHPWTDGGIDPYLATRARDAENVGTFWGKLLRRNYNYEGRRIDVLTGYLDDNGKYQAGNFKRRTYIISRISGPDENGNVRIEAKDPLKFADNEKAKWPEASTAILNGAITNSSTSFQIDDVDGRVASYFALGQHYVKIDKEILRLDSIASAGGTLINVTASRSTMPTQYDPLENPAAQHKDKAGVQPCWNFSAVPAADLVYYLLNDVVGINPSYLPKSEWDEEMLNGFQSYSFSALIASPTGVKDLLQEISEHNLMIWWDERNQKVRMRGVINKAPVNDVRYDGDVNFISGTSDVTDDYKNRCTQVWIFYGDRFPLLDRKKPSSYGNLHVRADLDAESEVLYDGQVIKTFYSRWLVAGSDAVPGEIAGRYLSNNKRAKKVITVAVDPKDDQQWTGDVVGISSPLIQDEHGAPAKSNMLVTQVDEAVSLAGVAYKMVLTEQSTLDRTGVIAPSAGIPDYPAASEAQRDRYIFIGPNTGRFADGSPLYQIQ